MSDLTTTPWRLVMSSNGARIESADGAVIAHLTAIPGVRAGLHQSMVDGRAMAAAPDLLEALIAVVSVADRATIEFDMARAAIARATQPEKGHV